MSAATQLWMPAILGVLALAWNAFGPRPKRRTAARRWPHYSRGRIGHAARPEASSLLR